MLCGASNLVAIFSCQSLLLGTSIPNDKLNMFMNKSTKILCFYNHVIVVLQFVLLMDPLSLKVEWKCIKMVNGVQCVIMDGI